MRARVLLAVLSIAVAAQLWVPVSLILRSERTLARGTAWRFRTAPVDPYDAFRGKYVALAFADRSAACAGPDECRKGRRVYASLGTDSAGFAVVSGLSQQRPDRGEFVRVTVASSGDGSVSFDYPFDHFFLEEDMAPAAERLYRERNMSGAHDSYLVVRVRNGCAVIEDLVIGGLPVRESVRGHADRE